MGKLPAFQFYPADWRKDPCLRACSYVTRGIWIEMLCVMFECSPRGYFTTNGHNPTPEEASRIIGCTPEEYQKAEAELEHNNVLSRDCHGIIFNRRMVKDQKVREQWKARQRSHRDVSKKGHPLSSSSSSSSKTKTHTRQFVSPTIEQVTDYCQERKNSVDPQKWFDYYTSNGWKVGKNPMKNWQAAVRTWEKNNGTVSTGRNNSESFFERDVREREETKQKARDILRVLGGGAGSRADVHPRKVDPARESAIPSEAVEVSEEQVGENW